MTVTLTPELEEALRDMRARRVPLYWCAQELGVSYRVAVRWARELNLHQRMNSGRRSGPAIHAAASRPRQPQETP